MDPAAGASRTIYVGNIPASIDEPTLRQLFANCGVVTAVKFAGQEGYRTRFVFVEFQDPSQAATACHLNGLQIADCAIRVQMSRSTIGGGGGGGGGGPRGGAPPHGGGPSGPHGVGGPHGMPHHGGHNAYGNPYGNPFGAMYGGATPGPYQAPNLGMGLGGAGMGNRANQDPERIMKTIHIRGVDPMR